VEVKNRIKELRQVPASQLKKNACNWRIHSEYQLDVLKAIIEEVGFAGAVIARELADGSLEIIDGHARVKLAGDEEIPVLVLDVNEAEAKKILATYDPISALADTDSEQLNALLNEVEVSNQSIVQLFEQLKTKAESYAQEAPADFKEFNEEIETNRVCPKCGYRWSE